MEVVKMIEKEQLEKIQKQQNEMNSLLMNIGAIEAQKQGLLFQLQIVSKDSDETKAELEKQYGAVSINLQDGSYTDIELEGKSE